MLWTMRFGQDWGVLRSSQIITQILWSFDKDCGYEWDEGDKDGGGKIGVNKVKLHEDSDWD